VLEGRGQSVKNLMLKQSQFTIYKMQVLFYKSIS